MEWVKSNQLEDIYNRLENIYNKLKAYRWRIASGNLKVEAGLLWMKLR